MAPNTGAVIVERERERAQTAKDSSTTPADFVPSELVLVDDRLYDAAKLSAWHPGGEVR